MLASGKFLIDCCKQLEIPIVVTEQYPKVFQNTCKELHFDGMSPFAKTSFSMLTDEVTQHLSTLSQFKSNQKHAIIFGLEVYTHLFFFLCFHSLIVFCFFAFCFLFACVFPSIFAKYRMFKHT